MSGYPLKAASIVATVGSSATEVIAGVTGESNFIKSFTLNGVTGGTFSNVILYEYGTGSRILFQTNIPASGLNGVRFEQGFGDEWLELGDGSALYLITDTTLTRADTNVYYNTRGG